MAELDVNTSEILWSYATPDKQIQKTDLSQICANETRTAFSIAQQTSLSLATTQEAGISLETTKPLCILEEIVPSPFKHALFWPEPKQPTL